MNPATTRVLSALVLLPVVLGIIWLLPPWGTHTMAVAAIGVAGAELWNMRGGRIPVWSVVWVGFPLLMLSEIREHFGPGVLMILLGTIIASDSGQYYAGRTFGRHKLAPVISPKKTVEGAIGGLIVGSGAAIILGRFWPIGLSDIAMAGVGLAMTVAGIAGDLFESHLKRNAGVKDSGNLIPGYGGILDRIDSWLFATPVFWCVLHFTR